MFQILNSKFKTKIIICFNTYHLMFNSQNTTMFVLPLPGKAYKISTKTIGFPWILWWESRWVIYPRILLTISEECKHSAHFSKRNIYNSLLVCCTVNSKPSSTFLNANTHPLNIKTYFYWFNELFQKKKKREKIIFIFLEMK